MSGGDFVVSSANDGTHLFRPVSARGHTFWQKQNFNRAFVNIIVLVFSSYAIGLATPEEIVN